MMSVFSFMFSGSSLHVNCSFPLWGVVFVCVENEVCEDGVCSVYICWWLNVRESSLSVCSVLCLVSCS